MGQDDWSWCDEVHQLPLFSFFKDNIIYKLCIGEQEAQRRTELIIKVSEDHAALDDPAIQEDD